MAWVPCRWPVMSTEPTFLIIDKHGRFWVSGDKWSTEFPDARILLSYDSASGMALAIMTAKPAMAVYVIQDYGTSSEEIVWG